MIIGLIHHDQLDYNLKNIKENSIAISGKGFKHKYNVEEVNN